MQGRIYGADVKGETVPDCGPSEGEGPFPESLSVCNWRTKREAVRRWSKLTRGCIYIYAVILTDTWDHLQKGSNDTGMRLDSVLAPQWYWKPVNGIRNRCDVMSPTASNNSWTFLWQPASCWQLNLSITAREWCTVEPFCKSSWLVSTVEPFYNSSWVV